MGEQGVVGGGSGAEGDSPPAAPPSVYAVVSGAGDFEAYALSVWATEAEARAEWGRLCAVLGDGPEDPPGGLIVNRWDLGVTDCRAGCPLHAAPGHTVCGREV